MVQGSRQEDSCITFEQRTEHFVSRLRRVRPIQRARVLPLRQNKSGTAEVTMPLSLKKLGTKASFFDY